MQKLFTRHSLWRGKQVSLKFWINLIQTCLLGMEHGCGQTLKGETGPAMGILENHGDKGYRGQGVPSQAISYFASLNHCYKTFLGQSTSNMQQIS